MIGLWPLDESDSLAQCVDTNKRFKYCIRYEFNLMRRLPSRVSRKSDIFRCPAAKQCASFGTCVCSIKNRTPRENCETNSASDSRISASSGISSNSCFMRIWKVGRRVRRQLQHNVRLINCQSLSWQADTRDECGRRCPSLDRRQRECDGCWFYRAHAPTNAVKIVNAEHYLYENWWPADKLSRRMRVFNRLTGLGAVLSVGN